jgi:glycerol uptake facilitator-like aquaporin
VTAQIVAALLATTEEKGRDLPVEPWAIGLGAFVLLTVLLAVTLTFGKDR